MNFKKYHVSKNLFDIAKNPLEQGSIDGTYGRDIAREDRVRTNGYITLLAGEYTINAQAQRVLTALIFIYDLNGNFEQRIPTFWAVTPMNFSLEASKKIRIAYAYDNDAAINPSHISNIMLNTGSTALPYEPYGYLWSDIPHYIHNTSTDTITTLPAVIYPNDTTATVGLKGQMEQSSTPTPDSPIMPKGTGERTVNLLESNPYKIGYSISNDGTEIQNSEFNIYTAKVSAGTQYCLSFVYPESARYRMVRIHEYSGGIWQSQLIAQNCELFPLSFVTSDNIDEVRISIINTTSNHMLNSGTTALPYEPYGYFIEIEVS